MAKDSITNFDDTLALSDPMEIAMTKEQNAGLTHLPNTAYSDSHHPLTHQIKMAGAKEQIAH
jgi:hypothetical protein